MHKIYELKEVLCEELEGYGSKDKLDISDLECIDTLAHSIKNINKIIEVYEEGYGEHETYEASRMPYPRNMIRRTGSYARGRRGSYNRDLRDRSSYDNSYRYYRNDGYSRAEEDMDSMVDELRDMMQDLPPEKQHEVQKFINRIEQM